MFITLFALLVSTFSFNSNCHCECNISSIADPFNSEGYGKYTGVRYSCPPIIYNGDYKYESGCDPLDECSKNHDICIGKYGYLNSCQCNIDLINCASPLIGNGFYPCNSMEKAKEIVLYYICDVILYEPTKIGGCNASEKIPNVCLEKFENDQNGKDRKSRKNLVNFNWKKRLF